ncbi:MAG TPA: hypothetical protein VFX70_21545 [Mycobacteriales bacterium]|nr:hypothetical protein [Mycobacteriales bacterium]
MYWAETVHGKVQILNEEGFIVDRGKITWNWSGQRRLLVVRCSTDGSEDRYSVPKVLALLNRLHARGEPVVL